MSTEIRDVTLPISAFDNISFQVLSVWPNCQSIWQPLRIFEFCAQKCFNVFQTLTNNKECAFAIKN